MPAITAHTTQQRLLHWALSLAERGWKVFPIVPRAKRPPAIRSWEPRATNNLDRIRRCWTHGPYNIGVAVGPSGLLVVDLDTPDPGETPPESWNRREISGGGDVLTELAARAESTVPATYTITTPSGRHLYFRQPPGTPLHNTAGTLGWLIDTRGHGGYVVGPGSITDDGHYEVHDDRAPVDLPGWLAQELAPKPSTALSAPHEIASTRHSAYVAAALQGEAQRVVTARSGRHNTTLFEAAAALGQLVAGGHLNQGDATHVLQQAAGHHVRSRCNCTQREVDQTIRSGLRVGSSRPRRLLQRKDTVA